MNKKSITIISILAACAFLTGCKPETKAETGTPPKVEIAKPASKVTADISDVTEKNGDVILKSTGEPFTGLITGIKMTDIIGDGAIAAAIENMFVDASELGVAGAFCSSNVIAGATFNSGYECSVKNYATYNLKIDGKNIVVQAKFLDGRVATGQLVNGVNSGIQTVTGPDGKLISKYEFTDGVISKIWDVEKEKYDSNVIEKSEHPKVPEPQKSSSGKKMMPAPDGVYPGDDVLTVTGRDYTGAEINRYGQAIRPGYIMDNRVGWVSYEPVARCTSIMANYWYRTTHQSVRNNEGQMNVFREECKVNHRKWIFGN